MRPARCLFAGREGRQRMGILRRHRTQTNAQDAQTMTDDEVMTVCAEAWTHPYCASVRHAPRGDGTFFVLVWWRGGSGTPTTITTLRQWRAICAPLPETVTIRPGPAARR